MNIVSNIIIRPIMTEQSLKDAAKGKYTFIVGQYATKPEIKDAIMNLYNVTVKKVYTNNVKEKRIRFTRLGKRTENLSYKKARVQVAAGQKIDLFEEQGHEDHKDKPKEKEKKA